MKSRPVKIPEEMNEDIEEYMESLGYASFSEFARDAIRDKIYRRELRPEFKKKIEQGLEDLRKGRVLSHEELKSDLGVDE